MEHSHEHTHTYTHSHEHDHAAGEEQIHEHEHEHEHVHAHEHTHTHADGTVHTHSHTHEDGHAHEHDHAEGGEGMTDIEKTRALLGYMIDHNEHHAEELADMLPALEGEAQKKLSEAIGCFEAGNVHLREVLELL